MFVNKYIVLLAFLLASIVTLPADAQRRGRRRPVVPKVTVEELVKQYRFDEAANQLRENMEKADKKGQNIDAFEEQLRRVTMGANMLRGTERVLFVDSIQVLRSDFLKKVMLSPESGKLVSSESEKPQMTVVPSGMGSIAHINELNDRMYFSMKQKVDSVKNICSVYRSRDKWGTPQFLPGVENVDENQDFPFVMPDGVTMYYAATGEASLGGYDLFVTRYDPTANKYLKAENLGMPFNSLANDYMLALDEINQLGWLVTDRNQPADSVCIYIFVPNESREVFDVSNTDPQLLVRAAKLSSVDECRYNATAVNDARQRLLALAGKSVHSVQKSHYYVINNGTVYTDLSQFRSEAARRIAAQSDKTKEQIDLLTAKYEDLSFIVAQGTRNAQIDKELNKIKITLPQLKAKYKTLCKNMRIAELK